MDNKDNLSRQKKKKHIRIKSKAIKTIIIFASSILFICFALPAILDLATWKSFNPDKLVNVKQTSTIYDSNNQIIAQLHGEQNRIKVPISKIPKDVKNAFIAVEDVRFYEHNGVDILRILGALWQDIKSRSFAQGASTITQQLIKNVYLSPKKTIARKIQEAFLSYQVERHYSKDKILEMYLNYIYFGDGAYGIETAARTYFNKDVSQLTLSEAAMLAGIPKYPSKYSPLLHYNDSINRRNLILDLMEKNKFITHTQALNAKNEKIVLSKQQKSTGSNGYYTDQAIHDAAEILNIKENDIYSGGYKIHTALNTDLQKYCEKLYNDNSLFPASKKDRQLESALCIIDPQTAEIKVLMGGRHYTTQMGLNRATQMSRQPGSTIKPVLVYAPAIEHYGYTPVTMLLDEKVQYGNYSPTNFENDYSGWMTLRDAVKESINVPAVEVFNSIGINSGKSFAESIGIPFKPEDNNLSLALGGFTNGVTPLQLCGSYMAFANEGKYTKPYIVKSIENSDGKIIYQNKSSWKQVMSKENAFIMTNILQSVIDEGTGKKLKTLGISDIAGKTGTVQLPDTKEFSGIHGTKDAWMVSYTSDMIAAVWMGYDTTDKNHYLSSSVTGGTYPAGMVYNIFKYAYKDKKPTPFIKPSGVIKAKIDKKTLYDKQKIMLANEITPSNETVEDYFTDKSIPKVETDYWVIPQPPTDLTVNSSSDNYPIISFTPKNYFALYRIYRQKNMNPPILISTVSDKNLNRIEYKDTMAVPGERYSYYVTAVHPDLTIDNQPISGPASKKVNFTMQFNITSPFGVMNHLPSSSP